MRSFSLLLAGIGLLFACADAPARPAAPAVIMPTVYEPKACTPETTSVPELSLPSNEAPAGVPSKPVAAVASGAAVHVFLSCVS